MLWERPAIEHPFPLPKQSRTEPHLAIKPHAGMINGLEKVISNREEIRPRHEKSKVRRLWSPKSLDFGIDELPLVAFTLFGQAAAGIAIWTFFSGPPGPPILVAIGLLIGLGGLASLMHLGNPQNAWRAVIHLRKSWLSREILMFLLFGGSWLVCLAMPGMGKLPLTICGIGLVFSMAQVYRLRSIPAWDTNRTLLAFIFSAIVLGGLGSEMLKMFGDPALDLRYTIINGIGLVGVLLLSLSDWDQAHQTARRLRLGLIGLSLIGLLGMYIAPYSAGEWMIVPIIIVVLSEEAIGRWLFYEHLRQRDM